MNIFYKLLLEVINGIVNTKIGIGLLGRFKVFDGVFVMYPADQSFADYFTFRKRQKMIAWCPFIVGVITHPSGKRTLMCAISSHVDGRNSKYDPEDLRELHKKVELLRQKLHATSTHFAGTLPGRLSTLKVRRGGNQGIEQCATAENVVKAIYHTTMNNVTMPIIILGSKGYVGRHVSETLEKNGSSVVRVDRDAYAEVDTRQSRYEAPQVVHLMVNITHPEAINDYIDRQMTCKTIFLNEVYPAPHGDVVQAMKEKGVQAYHIAGVEAHVWPKFPFSYENAVPCCAARPGENYKIVVIPL